METRLTQAQIFLRVVEAVGYGGVWERSWGEAVGSQGKAGCHIYTSLQAEASQVQWCVFAVH